MEQKRLWGSQLVKCSNKSCIDYIRCERFTKPDVPKQCYAVFKGLSKNHCLHYIPNIDSMRGKV